MCTARGEARNARGVHKEGSVALHGVRGEVKIVGAQPGDVVDAYNDRFSVWLRLRLLGERNPGDPEQQNRNQDVASLQSNGGCRASCLLESRGDDPDPGGLLTGPR
jgi:hypothetical protein